MHLIYLLTAFPSDSGIIHAATLTESHFVRRQTTEAAAITEAATDSADQDQARNLKKKQDPHALQSAFLAAHLGKPVTVFLMTGIRMTEKLRQHDQYCVLLEDAAGSINSLVFKHTISTVVPNRP